jgi:hypothetical protein
MKWTLNELYSNIVAKRITELKHVLWSITVISYNLVSYSYIIIVNSSNLDYSIYREYYTAARRYDFYLRVVINNILWTSVASE